MRESKTETETETENKNQIESNRIESHSDGICYARFNTHNVVNVMCTLKRYMF